MPEWFVEGGLWSYAVVGVSTFAVLLSVIVAALSAGKRRLPWALYVFGPLLVVAVGLTGVAMGQTQVLGALASAGGDNVTRMARFGWSLSWIPLWMAGMGVAVIAVLSICMIALMRIMSGHDTTKTSAGLWTLLSGLAIATSVSYVATSMEIGPLLLAAALIGLMAMASGTVGLGLADDATRRDLELELRLAVAANWVLGTAGAMVFAYGLVSYESAKAMHHAGPEYVSMLSGQALASSLWMTIVAASVVAAAVAALPLVFSARTIIDGRLIGINLAIVILVAAPVIASGGFLEMVSGQLLEVIEVPQWQALIRERKPPLAVDAAQNAVALERSALSVGTCAVLHENQAWHTEVIRSFGGVAADCSSPIHPAAVIEGQAKASALLDLGRHQGVRALDLLVRRKAGPIKVAQGAMIESHYSVLALTIVPETEAGKSPSALILAEADEGKVMVMRDRSSTPVTVAPQGEAVGAAVASALESMERDAPSSVMLMPAASWTVQDITSLCLQAQATKRVNTCALGRAAPQARPQGDTPTPAGGLSTIGEPARPEDTAGQGDGAGLPKEVIRRIMRRASRRAKSCYERELKRAGPGFAGKITLRFQVGPDGRVREASVANNTMPDSAEFEDCLVRAVRGLRFPAGEGRAPVMVSYPFVFKPG